MLLFATSPVTLALTTNPNSHATAGCCVVSGMFFLLQWWRRQSGWRALVALFNLRWRDRTSWEHLGLLALGWLIPVGGLVAYNLAAMGTITGYDATNESVGFSLVYAIDNWETMLRQLATTGLFFALPLAFAGLVAMFWRNWRTAAVMMAWVVPCVVIYTFYYWAPDTSSVGYLRFYLTILPALAAAAAWAGRAIVDVIAASNRAAAGAALAGFTLIIAIASAGQLRQGLEIVENEQNTRLSLQSSIEQIERAIPEGSMIVCGEFNFLHHLQFIRDDVLYNGETFNRGQINGLVGRFDPNEPQGLDPQRRAALAKRFEGFDQKKLDDEQVRLINASLAAGKHVFYILPLREGLGLPRLKGDIEPFRRGWPELLRRMVKGHVFDPTIAAAWNVPAVRTMGDRAAQRARRADVRHDRRSGYWQIVEIKKKPPTTKPARISGV
jgi:hypothetical protein